MSLSALDSREACRRLLKRDSGNTSIGRKMATYLTDCYKTKLLKLKNSLICNKLCPCIVSTEIG